MREAKLNDIVTDIWENNPEAEYTTEQMFDMIFQHDPKPHKVLNELVDSKKIMFEADKPQPTYRLTNIVKRKFLQNL